MIKDILGKILDMKKQGNLVVKIEIEPEKMEEGDEAEMKAQGMAPAPGDKKEEMGEENEMEMDASDLMDADEMRMMKRKRKMGMAPRGLSERVKMDSIEE
jgi:hypothetical protein